MNEISAYILAGNTLGSKFIEVPLVYSDNFMLEFETKSKHAHEDVFRIYVDSMSAFNLSPAKKNVDYSGYFYKDVKALKKDKMLISYLSHGYKYEIDFPETAFESTCLHQSNIGNDGLKSIIPKFFKVFITADKKRRYVYMRTKTGVSECEQIWVMQYQTYFNTYSKAIGAKWQVD